MLNEPANVLNNRYRLHNVLGEGGMGVVYHATDRLTGQSVALKRVILGDAEGDAARLALAQEFKLLASLRHPHVISVLDYGFDADGNPFYTMTLLKDPRTLTVAAAALGLQGQLKLLIQLFQALAYLHRRGIIHRDLKPSNVLVTPEHVVKVVDFGVALRERSDEASHIAGTVLYMAPEIFRDIRPSSRSDLYSAGVLAYEILNGKHPYDHHDLAAVVSAILTTTIDFSGTPTLVLDQLPDTMQFAARPPQPTEPNMNPALENVEERETKPIFVPAPMNSDALAPHTDDSPSADGSGGGNPLVLVLERLLAKKPEERYDDAEQVVDDLRVLLGQPLDSETPAIRESFLQAAAFVGRSTELQQLEAALQTMNATSADAAQQTTGAAFLIGGESGIGKTRLIDEFRASALVSGVLVLVGQGAEGGGIPYQFWREPLRRLILSLQYVSDLEASILKPIVPDIGRLLRRSVADSPTSDDAHDEQRRIVETIVAVFRRAPRPILLILEDLHWALESLEPLKKLLDIVPTQALIVVGSFRNDEKPNLHEHLPAMQHLPLRRLNLSEIEALSTAMLGMTARQQQVLRFIEQETEGNVFFIVETVRAMAEEAGRLRDIGPANLSQTVLAGGVQQLIQRRLGRVPRPARRMLEVAAVQGRILDLDVLRHIAREFDYLEGSLESWLVQCAAVSVLDVADERWRFAHDKLREATVQGIAAENVAPFNRQVALAYEAVYADTISAHAMSLTRHWEAAGDWVRTAHYAHIAAQHAYQTSNYTVARELAEKAVAVLQALDTGTNSHAEAELFRLLGKIYDEQGEFKRSMDYFWLCKIIADDLNDTRLQIYALQGIGDAEFNLNQREKGFITLREALALAEKQDDLAVLCDMYNALGTAYNESGKQEQAQQFYTKTIDLAQRLNNPWRIARAQNNIGNVLWELGDLEGAMQNYRQSLAGWRALGSQRGIAIALNNLGVLAEGQQMFAEALQYYTESLDLAHNHNDNFTITICLLNIGYTQLKLEKTHRAYATLKEALRRSQDLGVNVLLLYALAGVAGAASERENGAAVLYVIRTHPDVDLSSGHVQDMEDRIKAALGETAYAQAYAGGAALEFETVLQEVLQGERLSGT